MGYKIEFDEEAYRRLDEARREGESFSDAVKRIVPATKPVEPFDVEAWLELLRQNPMSQEAIDAVEERLRQRRGPRCDER